MKSLRNRLLEIACVACAAVALTACESGGDTKAGPKASLPATPPSATSLVVASTEGKAGADDAAADPGALLTGTTAARRTSQVSASGSGLLVELKVREGDFVKAGEIIAVLDRRDAALRVAQAEAGMKSARVQLASAEREVARLEKLDKDQAVPTAELDRIRSARDAASAGVESATVAVSMARKMAGDADVHAPFAGLVTARLKGEGEWISTMPPAPLIMLAEVDPLDLKIDVPAALLPRVKAGDAVTVRFPAIGRELTTRITRVVPQVTPQTRAFSVYAELPNEDRSLAPGLFAEVRLDGAAPSAEARSPDARAPGSAAQ
jgi:RND family efflux transporter MFP subunit